MQINDFREEVCIEFEVMTADTLEAGLLLQEFTGSDQVPLWVCAAGSALLVDFYSAFETVLKLIHMYHGINLPDGNDWQKKLLSCFSNPGCQPFPALFDRQLLLELSALRAFRQSFCDSNGFRPVWPSVQEGLDRMRGLNQQVTQLLGGYVSRLG